MIDDSRDVLFRSLAAPGLDEDDLFAAANGLPGSGALWGDGHPGDVDEEDSAWDEARERRRRHEALLRKWGPPPG